MVLAGPARAEAGSIPLAIYDLQTREERPIPGSAIGYPAEGIPRGQLTISPDVTKFYWASAFSGPTVIHRANMDGSGLTRLGTVSDIVVTLSGDGLVAYAPGQEGVPPTIILEDLQAGTHTEVGEGSGAMGWRPIPTL